MGGGGTRAPRFVRLAPSAAESFLITTAAIDQSQTPSTPPWLWLHEINLPASRQHNRIAPQCIPPAPHESRSRSRSRSPTSRSCPVQTASKTLEHSPKTCGNSVSSTARKPQDSNSDKHTQINKSVHNKVFDHPPKLIVAISHFYTPHSFSNADRTSSPSTSTTSLDALRRYDGKIYCRTSVTVTATVTVAKP